MLGSGAAAAAEAMAAAVVVARLARGRTRRPPLEPREGARVSVVIPARDEERRIGPCLEAVRRDPDAAETIVVDDGSSDATAAVARRLGARVLAAPERPENWIGKPWALQRGVEAAACDVVVCLDADTRPRPGLLAALAAELADADFVTAGARFVCGTAGERWLHPSFLVSLVYRYGPAGADGGRTLANGQCTVTRRAPFLAAGGYAAAVGHLTDDAALVRSLERRGWRVAFADATRLVDVDMHDGAKDLWREWGRSIALADVESRWWLAADVALIWLALGLPMTRLLAGRPRRRDAAWLGLRVAVMAPLGPAYSRRGPAFWLSPLADPATAARLTWSALRPPRRWRGREYAGGGRAGRRTS